MVVEDLDSSGRRWRSRTRVGLGRVMILRPWLGCLPPLCRRSTVQCQHEQDIVDPPSIVELFQEHPSDIPLVGTVEAIRMQEAVALLIRPGMDVVALTQNHPGE